MKDEISPSQALLEISRGYSVFTVNNIENSHEEINEIIDSLTKKILNLKELLSFNILTKYPIVKMLNIPVMDEKYLAISGL